MVREKLNEWTVKRPESTLIRGESSGLPFTAMDWHPYQQLLAFALYSQSQEASCIVLYHLHHQSKQPVERGWITERLRFLSNHPATWFAKG